MPVSGMRLMMKRSCDTRAMYIGTPSSGAQTAGSDSVGVRGGQNLLRLGRGRRVKSRTCDVEHLPVTCMVVGVGHRSAPAWLARAATTVSVVITACPSRLACPTGVVAAG